MNSLSPQCSPGIYPESALLPLSALQHLAFCERQCALIHIEQVWSENRYTAEGRVLHDRVHEQQVESRGELLVVRGLKLRSVRLGLTGIADLVEFRRDEKNGIPLTGHRGHWIPFPVEYKRGKPKKDTCDEVQLCAQALCLEELLAVSITHGALYYGEQHKRYDVVFDEFLRNQTAQLAARLQALFSCGKTPSAQHGKKCQNCSLAESCVPQLNRDVTQYLEHLYQCTQDC